MAARTRRAATVLLATAIALGAGTAEARSKDGTPGQRPIAIEGAWFNDIPCLPTSGEPSQTVPPQTADFSCSGTSVYTGDWIGHTSYTATGTVDLAAREVVGTAEQVFTGIYAADGSHGSVRFRSVVQLDLETGAFRDSSVIIEGTCGFEGSKGWVEFEGLSAAGVLGGTYVGSWKRKAAQTGPTCVPAVVQ